MLVIKGKALEMASPAIISCEISSLSLAVSLC